MTDYKVCYRKDTGAVLSIKPTDFEFSDREKGECISGIAASCRCFNVFTVSLSDEDLETYTNAIIVNDSLEDGQTIVDDIDTPTAIELYEAP